MPDKYGQLLPGEEEKGIEEGDFSDYISPFTGGLKRLGKGIISRLIKNGIPTKPKHPPRPATKAEQEKINKAYPESTDTATKFGFGKKWREKLKEAEEAKKTWQEF